jgi:nitrite reductase (NO-forming)
MMQRFTGQSLLRGALLVAVLASVACASPTSSEVTPASTAPDGAQRLTINVGDGMKFEPDAISVRAGQPLELTLRNAGQSAHDFTLSQGVAQPVKLVVNGGETASGTFTMDQPGTYTFECSMPGHAIAGMRGTIIAQ